MSIVSGSQLCKSCGGTCSGSDRFCPSCGGSLVGVANCPNCGTSCSPGDRFCRTCAKPLHFAQHAVVTKVNDITAAPVPNSNKKPLADWLTVGAGFALLALCAQCQRGRGEMPSSLIPLGIAIGIVVITGIVGVVVSVVWNRIAGQLWASGLVIAAAGVVLGIRWFSIPFLGITTYSLGDALMVSDVTPDSAAARAGIGSGQVILAVDGRSFTNPGDLVTYIRSRHVFDTIRVRVAIPPGTLAQRDITLGD